jgi:putative N6-adenine-specific DNA methylase
LFDSHNATFFVSTIHGLEQELADEIVELAQDLEIELSQLPEVASAGVYVRAPWSFCLAMNFGLRCASRVLCEVLECEARTLEDVYKAVFKLDWEKLFPLEMTFSVQSTSSDAGIKANALNLKIKDAIVDSFKRSCGSRPDVEKEAPQVRVMARVHRGGLSVSLDTTGTPLALRGYRTATHDAPLSELLGAGLLRMTGWHKLCRELRKEKPEKAFFARVETSRTSTHEVQEDESTTSTVQKRRIPEAIVLTPDLIDPMCGTGTFAIEAALQLLNRRPQLDRTGFAYENLSLIPSAVLKQEDRIRRALRAQELSLLDAFRKVAQYKREALGRSDVADAVAPFLLCRDTDTTALAAAKKNAEKAGVSKLIQFEKGNVVDLQVDSDAGVIVMNPPYGVRLGEEEQLKIFYKDIGDALKKRCKGWQAWILAGSNELAGSVGLRPTRRRKVFNGGIECLWLQYVLF